MIYFAKSKLRSHLLSKKLHKWHVNIIDSSFNNTNSLINLLVELNLLTTNTKYLISWLFFLVLGINTYPTLNINLFSKWTQPYYKIN
jgi:hypothetical protein